MVRMRKETVGSFSHDPSERVGETIAAASPHGIGSTSLGNCSPPNPPPPDASLTEPCEFPVASLSPFNHHLRGCTMYTNHRQKTASFVSSAPEDEEPPDDVDLPQPPSPTLRDTEPQLLRLADISTSTSSSSRRQLQPRKGRVSSTQLEPSKTDAITSHISSEVSDPLYQSVASRPVEVCPVSVMNGSAQVSVAMVLTCR